MTARYTDPAAVEALARMRDDPLDRDILDAIARATAPVNAEQIADMTGLCAHSIQVALHGLDDDGRVLMRIGRYRLSEAERARRGAAQLRPCHLASRIPQAAGIALTGQEKGDGNG